MILLSLLAAALTWHLLGGRALYVFYRLTDPGRVISFAVKRDHRFKLGEICVTHLGARMKFLCTINRINYFYILN